MTVLFSFLIGGILCLAAQLLIDLTKLTPARILVIYVCSGVFLYAIGIFDILVKYFGFGLKLPLIGFGANIASGVKSAVMEKGFFGIIQGSFSECGGGICFALLAGFIVSLFSRGKAKRM